MSQAAELTMEKHYDPIGSRIGMWLFLFTEFLLFGGLFLLYAIYLNKYPEEFHYGSSQLDQFVGAMNTIILLTSSLTMVLAVGALQRDRRKLSIFFLVTTFTFGAAFLINKYFEWGHKIELGIYPGSQELTQHPQGEIVFYGLYYAMTGLHGLHVIIGMVIMLFLLYFLLKKSHRALSIKSNQIQNLNGKRLLLSDETGKKLWKSQEITSEVTGMDVVVKGVFTEEQLKSSEVKLENSGLYWHLVDIIWIFLFPLFYLVSM
ncbi:MAG: cytochrome c oxidase subunit 3 [Calditrichaeota bacterium]|nr:cytochrome c oxidase subunit 3 [Calditrichota bacterium]